MFISRVQKKSRRKEKTILKKTKKRTLPKYIQKKVEKVNKIFNEWSESGLTSNDLELSQSLLRRFYRESKKKNVKEKEMASSRILVDKEQKEEYNKILDFILSDEFVDLKKRQSENENIRQKFNEKSEKTFNTLKKRYDFINDEQSFINFTDNMNRYKNDRMLSAILSSEQIANLYGYGYDKGFSESEIDEILIDTYNKVGFTGLTLYEKTLKKMKVKI